MSRKLHKHASLEINAIHELISKDEFWLLSKSQRKAYNYFLSLRGIEPYHKKDRETDSV